MDSSPHPEGRPSPEPGAAPLPPASPAGGDLDEVAAVLAGLAGADPRDAVGLAARVAEELAAALDGERR